MKKMIEMFKLLKDLITYWGDEQEDITEYEYYQMTMNLQIFED